MPLSSRLPVLAFGAVVLASCASAALAQDEPISIVRDTEIEAILHQEADPIFVAAGLDPKKVEIHIIGDKELNAFSTSGLNIYVNTGLIVKTDTPDQLVPQSWLESPLRAFLRSCAEGWPHPS